jgi:triphosphatase
MLMGLCPQKSSCHETDACCSVAEIEIKLQVPAHALAAVRAALRRGRCATTRLRAIYFDTREEALAAAHCVLRLRQEGRRWVQAIKAPGDGALVRFEHEVDLGAPRTRPSPDLARHAGVPGIDAFERALGRLDKDGGSVQPLLPSFETDVRRTHRVVRSGDARIEIALDEGAIVAGARRDPVCEIEFELQTGSVDALTALAGQWAERHGLWLDVQTKAERGIRLAHDQPVAPPAHTKAPSLTASMAPDAALRACVRAALAPVLRNASVVAGGRAASEHVHQLRVGLRRLFSLQREFGAWSPAFDAALLDAPRAWFKALGGVRDVDALAASLLPRLAADDAPPLPPLRPAEGSGSDTDPAALFRSGRVTRTLLALMAFAHGDATATDDPAADLRALAAPPLARLHRKLRRAGKAFDALDDDARHRARKQLKRLRYGAEALSALWPDKAWADYLRRLKTAQDALGHFQDLCVARAVFEAQRDAAPTSWFALGWIAAERRESIAQSRRALRGLGRTPKFLR